MTKGPGVVVKGAETDSDRRRLQNEAEVLRAVIHPGVVALTGVDEAATGMERLTFRQVEGRPLPERGHHPATVAAGWGAAVATILADLHDLGFAHGAIRAEHVLIDDQGHPVLCGFGDACSLRDRPDAHVLMADDVRAAAQMVLRSAPALDRRARRILAAYIDGRPRRRLSARTLAVDLVRAVPGAHLAPPDVPGRPETEPGATSLPGPPAVTTADPVPDTPRADLPPERPGRWPARLSATAAIVTMVVGAALATGHLDSHRSPAPPSGYVLRSAGGQSTLTVTGRWGCGTDRPAVLDVASGSVWVFAGWPGPGRDMAGRLITRLPGAVGIGVASESGGCDRLVVWRAGQPDVALDVGGRA
ncbi:MAG: hypothetical protein M0Z30_24085 [Actinomycetota bacterium]|nr:hypothetical protein [Actinomycetota bacterium]